MRLIAIHVGVARTINLGNYNSAKIEASLTAEPDDGEDVAEVKARLQLELRQMLEDTWRAQIKRTQQVAEAAE